jgi:hypothetical protein
LRLALYKSFFKIRNFARGIGPENLVAQVLVRIMLSDVQPHYPAEASSIDYIDRAMLRSHFRCRIVKAP